MSRSIVWGGVAYFLQTLELPKNYAIYKPVILCEYTLVHLLYAL